MVTEIKVAGACLVYIHHIQDSLFFESYFRTLLHKDPLTLTIFVQILSRAYSFNETFIAPKSQFKIAYAN